MTWYTMGAAIVTFMLAVNLAVFVLRRGARGRTASAVKRPLSAHELGTYAAVVMVWVIGFASPYVWPGSQFAEALTQPWARLCLVAWPMLVGIVLIVLMKMARSRLGR